MGSVSGVITLGLFGGPVVTLGLGSSTVVVGPTLVGQWSNVLRLEAVPQRAALQAAAIGRVELEAKDSNG